MSTAQLDPILRHLRKLVSDRDLQDWSDQELLDAFASRNEEAAFSVLVARHGPMVLRVCRRALGHEQDAEDAFQATFLVLARSSGSIRKKGSLPDWLHGVAYRTAMKAKRSAARRRLREARLRSASPVNGAAEKLRPSAGLTWEEVQTTLDEELRKLAEPYRAAFVLCVLEGKSGPDAAALLGCKEATVSSRLTRARQRLQQQLSRRGVHLGALLAALAVSEGLQQAAVAGALAQSAVRLGLLTLGGKSAIGQIPPHIATLAEGVTGAMFLTQFKIATVFVLATCFLAGAGTLVHHAPAALDEAKRSSESAAEQPSRGDSEMKAKGKAGTQTKDSAAEDMTVTGRVLDAQGTPLAGAKLFLCDEKGKRQAPQSVTDENGRFRFNISTQEPRGSRALVATAYGQGLDWANVRPHRAEGEITLRLPVDVPVVGKVVDLEGKPVGGAAVDIVELTTSESGTLDNFLKKWEADKEKQPTGPSFHLLTEKQLWPREAASQLAATTTAPDGTFRLTGIGRDRGLMIRVRGAGIADQYERVLTRQDFRARPVGQGQVALSGPEPTIAVSQSKPIVGTVRDAQTNLPVAGVRVLCYTPSRPIHWWWKEVQTKTDAQGRYRLDGLAKAGQQIVTCDPGPGAPHMHRFDSVSDTDGFDPITHDMVLHRGVVVSGQVIDHATGRPARARVVYCPLITNQNFQSTPGYAAPRTQLSLWIDSREMNTGADGRYQLTALPGPGALFVMALGDTYMPAAAAKEDRDPAFYQARSEVFLTVGLGDIFPLPMVNAYRLIKPAADDHQLTVDFGLDRGLTRKGRLIDPEGKPIDGAEAFGLEEGRGPRQHPALNGAEFEARAINPTKPRRVLFVHAGRKLAGTAVLRGNEPEPITISMQPLTTLTGRALQRSGEPLAGYSVEYSAWPEVEWPGYVKRRDREPNLTDPDGRFRITGLPAGVPLSVSIVDKNRFAPINREKITLKPGEIKDLGTLRGDPRPGE